MDFYPCLAEIIDKCQMSDVEVFAPEEEISLGDEVLEKELSYDLKKLYAACRCFSKELEELEQLVKEDGSLMIEFVRKKSFLEIMDNVFWHELIDGLDLWGYSGKVIGLRVGWKVVVFENRRKEEQEELEELARQKNRKIRNPIDLPFVPAAFFLFSNRGGFKDLPPIAS